MTTPGRVHAPVDEMHAVAHQWVAVAADLGANGPPEIDITLWPSAVGTGALHGATEVTSELLRVRVLNTAEHVTTAARGYRQTDASGADALKAVSDMIGHITQPAGSVIGAVAGLASPAGQVISGAMSPADHAVSALLKAAEQHPQGQGTT